MKRMMMAAVFCAAVCQGADTASLEAGKKAEATYCVACHSTRLIDSQRLSAAAWAKEVDKMAGWGAVVPDKQMLIDYLAAEYSNTKPAPAPATSGNGAKH